MPRVARIVVPGLPHHVIQRGNNRQNVFFVDDDRRHYLATLREQSLRHGVTVLAYCLMNNHVHLIAVPRTADGLARAIGRTHWLHAQYVNRLHRRSGHLWQGRFFSCCLDELHLWRAVCYVERNPVRARLTRVAWTYAWSSAAAHVGEADRAEVLDMQAWKGLAPRGGWRARLRRPEDEQEMGRLRRALRTGRPLASDSLLSRMEKRLGRRLRAAPVGRPRQRPKPARKQEK